MFVKSLWSRTAEVVVTQRPAVQTGCVCGFDWELQDKGSTTRWLQIASKKNEKKNAKETSLSEVVSEQEVDVLGVTLHVFFSMRRAIFFSSV